MADVLHYNFGAPKESPLYSRLVSDLYRQKYSSGDGLMLVFSEYMKRTKGPGPATMDLVRLIHDQYWYYEEHDICRYERFEKDAPKDSSGHALVNFDDSSDILVQQARLLQLSPARRYLSLFDQARNGNWSRMFLSGRMSYFKEKLRCRFAYQSSRDWKGWDYDEHDHYQWLSTLADHRMGLTETEVLKKREIALRTRNRQRHEEKEAEAQAQLAAEAQPWIRKKITRLLESSADGLSSLSKWIRPQDK